MIKQKEGLDFFVTNANILIDEYEDQFKVITTPGGIWKQLQSELEELISFYPNLHHAGILEETKAIVSPTGTDILFFYNHKIVTLNLSTKRSRILVKDGTTDKYDDPSKYYGDKKNVIRSNHDPVVKFELIEPSPKWSPDGKYIAYMDCQHWEFRTNLWLINSDGSNDTCLVKLTGSGEEQVKAFEWHPTKNEIFYLQGYAFGPPSGGNLYITDVNGNKSLAVQTESNDRLKIFNFKIETDGIYFTVAQFDANDIIPLRDRLHIKLSFSQIYQGAIITPKMLGLL